MPTGKCGGKWQRHGQGGGNTETEEVHSRGAEIRRGWRYTTVGSPKSKTGYGERSGSSSDEDEHYLLLLNSRLGTDPLSERGIEKRGVRRVPKVVITERFVHRPSSWGSQTPFPASGSFPGTKQSRNSIRSALSTRYDPNKRECTVKPWGGRRSPRSPWDCV